LRPGFGCRKNLITSPDQIFLRLRAEARSENRFVVPESWFGRRDLDDRPIGITEIDGGKILTIVRSRDVHPEIRETSFPFQTAVPCRNMEGKMVVRSSSPTPFRIADPRTCDAGRRGSRIDEAGFRHHVEYWIPFDIANGVSPFRLALEHLKSESDDRQTRIEMMDGPFH
jgi:hypothetical protein